jgi:hypothetical protein
MANREFLTRFAIRRATLHHQLISSPCANHCQDVSSPNLGEDGYAKRNRDQDLDN